MKNLFVFLIPIVFISFLYAQENTTQELCKIKTDDRSGKPMLVGFCTKEILLSDTNFSVWFLNEFNKYVPDKNILNMIKLDEIKIVCIQGTWCSDSRREVPRFFKILYELNYDLENLTMICVDRKKQADNIDVDQFVIEKVPTFIFYKDDSELGRIIETPKNTLEIDLLEILLGEAP